MSSGFQIRENHHLDDVAYAVDRLIRSNILGISEVTAGKGIQLRDLASTVFKAFNLEHLIKIGSIEIKHKEKLSNDYKINPNLSCSNFRNPTEGVVAYLKGII
jgi:nucleoside-diphosphate-sugar epimerase